jgi:hypothetical protein
MPYLDISDPDNFTYLLQLFYAAHPHYQQGNERVRQSSGLAQDYFLSMPIARELAAWARKRHLITRAAAARIVEVMESLTCPSQAIADVVPITPRALGDPPQRFLTVLNRDIERWIDRHDPAGATTEILPLEMAIPLVRRFLATVDLSKDARDRAEQLHNWLVHHQSEPSAQSGL